MSAERSKADDREIVAECLEGAIRQYIEDLREADENGDVCCVGPAKEKLADALIEFLGLPAGLPEEPEEDDYH
jgi:hypothetical protein